MCGLIGIASTGNASVLAVVGLYAQQHRGREASGVASADGTNLFHVAERGEVQHVFPDGRDIPRELPGSLAVGHVRYSTVTKDERNSLVCQPIQGSYGGRPFCIAHNGNIVNTQELMDGLDPTSLTSSVDTEIVARCIESSYTSSLEKDLVGVFRRLRGSYSFLILFSDEMIAVRDPSGCRPLCIGAGEGILALASETCAFETLNVASVGEVEPGSFVRVSTTRTRNVIRFADKNERRCSFEPVYFSHPTSTAFGVPLVDFRLRLGEMLERECPTPGADIVLGVPDSSVVIAIGYGKSGRSGHFVPALTRHHYAGGRTFILPYQNRREEAVRRKFQCSVSAIEGKNVVLVDDSIVRATTMRLLVKRIRQAGANEVHVRSAFPPVRYSCFYGIDTPHRTELIAAGNSLEEIKNFIGADSLAYLSEKTLVSALEQEPSSWCTACVNGRYWH